MTADLAFSLVTYAALAGWIVLVAGVITRRRVLVEWIAGRLWPLGLCVIYAGLAPGFFTAEQGGFDSLANLQVLVGAPWLLLGGWIHWLAADLFIAAWISLQVTDRGMGRGWLGLILPICFLVGPVGFLAFHLLLAARMARLTSQA